MSDTINHGVVGQDGGVPIYDPKALWKMWNMNEIYLGTIGEARYVPKINDLVVELPAFIFFIVESLDPVTLVPQLREIKPAGGSSVLNTSDILFGVGPGSQAQLMRAYVNTTTIPATLGIDALLRVGGSMVSYAKIFKGGVIDGVGEVISKVYDAAGNFVSENVALELVEIDNHTNYCWKVVRQCYTTAHLRDGEVLTVVFYNANGSPISKSQVLVENTNYIRSLNASRKYVTHISLDSPFILSGNDFEIQFPLNIPKSSVNMEGVVHYSDGSQRKYPVNNNKFALLGFDQLVSTIAGQKIPLTLRYTLDANETSAANQSADDKYVVQPYDLRVVNPNNSYSVKLFAYPTWDPILNGYNLRWWMLNLDRNFFVEVTGLVNFDASYGAYNPQLFGVVQRKQVSINLKNVSAVFKPFMHTQLVEITLFSRPEDSSTPWLVSMEAIATRPNYGQGLRAEKKGATEVWLGSDLLSKEEWIEKVYKQTFPMINPSTEISAPLPTHFQVGIGNTWQEFTIGEWNNTLTMPIGVTLNDLLLIKFIKNTSTGPLVLSLAAMLVK